MNTTSVNKLIRPLVRDLHAYVPGEQPSFEGLSSRLNRLNSLA